MRFDDTLETVLAGDLRSAQGVQSAWRQIVDLIGRRRAPADQRAMAVLREIRPHVPRTVRAASAKALEFADPPPPLVRLLALDDLPVAMPVLRSARMSATAWIELLPELEPAARNVLRNRRDLSPAVQRALESFGAADFVLPDGRALPAEPAAPAPSAPAVASAPLTPVAATSGAAGPFEVADVVARIESFWRDREAGVSRAAPPKKRASEFRFETDASGTIRWVAGVSRAPLIGLSLDLQGMPQGSRVDGIAAGAFRRKASFANARMTIEGESDAAGDWLISAIPVFESANGRFSGYRGTARRPRVDERAEPARAPIEVDALRQLVHELRTPTNAIAGFAEMIEAQMLGPVSDPYRERAAIVREQARELMGAIDDLDLAARIESAALSLAPGRVALRPMIAAIAGDLAQLSELRGSMIALPVHDLAVSGDHRAVERLLARLMATLVSASTVGERIRVQLALEGEQMVAITIDRPRALADYPGESVLGIDDEEEDVTLLGTGFALRLARNLARELGGTLVIAPESLTLRLPAAASGQMGHVSRS
ncbi:sensor histidine kinase [Sphingomonas sp. RS6]